jgi:beta-glucanase (GH16 family)
MKYSPYIFAVICSLFAGCNTDHSVTVPVDRSLPPPPAGYEWQLNSGLSDEFNGTGLDTNKWIPNHVGWKGREPSHFSADNVSLADGTLRLRSVPTVTNLEKVADPKKDVWIASSCVSSRHAEASYGYYEARVKASLLSMTSAFWLQGDYSEIDVVEELGAPIKKPELASMMLMNTHFFKDGWSKDKAVGSSWHMPKSASADYHVYGVWWKDENTAWFYHDGENVAAVQFAERFAEPMRIFLDTEAFAWEGLPTMESLKDPKKNTMSVDWVRSWRLVKTGTTPKVKP